MNCADTEVTSAERQRTTPEVSAPFLKGILVQISDVLDDIWIEMTVYLFVLGLPSFDCWHLLISPHVSADISQLRKVGIRGLPG